MWWHRTNHHLNSINPHLGVGYVIPEGWSARKIDSIGGIQLLPAVTQSVYPAAMFLRVFPDTQNTSPENAIDAYATAQSAVAEQFGERNRQFKVHPSGFVYASIEYTIESGGFPRIESHHVVAFDIDGRASVTTSSCPAYWLHCLPKRDGFVASLDVSQPELAVKDHFTDNGGA